jgi:hypothetical protein
MINCEQGDVILLSFPFTDLTMVKQRPALVLSADWFNASGEDWRNRRIWNGMMRSKPG